MVLNWNEWYSLAHNYYIHHGNLLVPRNFKTKNGYTYDECGYNLGKWIATQRVAYKNINVKKENRKNSYLELTSEKIKLLENIGMYFAPRPNKIQIVELCHYFNIDDRNISYLINKITYEELNAKINYLISNNKSIIEGNMLNKIFYLSSDALETMYGINIKELIEKYYDPNIIRNEEFVYQKIYR